jgi:hypothetical protein
MADDTSDDYEVGYGKPPKSGQFRPGTSGNPRGRPKGSLDFKTYVQEMLSRKVTITEGGKRRRVSALEATLMRLAEKGLKGDTQAIAKILSLASEMAAELQAKQESRALVQADEDILVRFAASLVVVPAPRAELDDAHGGEPDERE